MRNIKIGATSLAILAAGIIAMSPAIKAADRSDSDEVNKLLSDAKTEAFQLKEDAFAMEGFTRSSHEWQSHGLAVERIKAHVNEAGRIVAKLDEARGSASPWQAIAIDRIKPLLKEIAANTTTVIEHINKNPKHLFAPEYKDYLEANADAADRLSRLVADFVDYGNTKNRLERLASKLEISGGA